MKRVLQINTSLRAGDGQSSLLATRFVERLQRTDPAVDVVVRDLAQDPVPHLDAERFGAFLAKPELRSEQQRRVVEFSDAVIAQIQNADVIVIGLPMYNFGVPSTLKAYFDHIARAGVTFSYTEKGPVGLLTGKQVYIFATRGGAYAGTPMDTQTPFVRDFLAFLGMRDVQFIYAEGLAMSEGSKQIGLGSAHLAIDQLFAPQRQAA